MGLLIPQSVGNSNNYRYYSVSQFQRLEMILQMKSVGLSLKQIKTILDTRNLSVFEALLSEQIDKPVSYTHLDVYKRQPPLP